MDVEHLYVDTRFSKKYFAQAIPGFACLLVSAFMIRNGIVWNGIYWGNTRVDVFFGVASFVFTTLSCVLLKSAMKEMAKNRKRKYNYIKINGTFRHLLQRPLTPDMLTAKLETMGFAVNTYFMDNYLCTKTLPDRRVCHVFIRNSDTPDCEEAQEFLDLFIDGTVAIYKQKSLIHFKIDIDFTKDVESNKTYIETLRQGCVFAESGDLFSFSTAYDSKYNVLYYADAVNNVKWDKGFAIGKYISEITAALFDML